jgi:hypothetical protein
MPTSPRKREEVIRNRGASDLNFKQPSAFSRQDMPELCVILVPQKIEGAGNAGRWPHPQACVLNR